MHVQQRKICLSLLQVLILEPTKVYQPSYLSINKDVDDNTVSIWHVAPDDKVGVRRLYDPAALTLLLFVHVLWILSFALQSMDYGHSNPLQLGSQCQVWKAGFLHVSMLAYVIISSTSEVRDDGNEISKHAQLP